MEAKMALVEVFRYSARNKESSTKLQELWELHKAQGINEAPQNSRNGGSSTKLQELWQLQ